jgi:capsular exopolysaccharide synthesis family protein
MSINEINEQQNQESFDFRQYWLLIWHWMWLIILIALAAGVAAFLVSLQMTPYYESAATVLVNEAPATQNADYSSVLMSEQLTSTYAKMMANDTVLSVVSTQLGISIPLDDMKEMITISSVPDTQLITVTVESTDPFLSANIANSVATVFASQIQAIQTERFSQSKTTLESQIATVEAQISDTETKKSQSDSEDEKNRLENELTQYRENYSSLQASYQEVILSEAQSVSSVVLIESAVADLYPVRPKYYLNAVLAGILGFLVTLGIIMLKEALDDTVKTPDDVMQKFGVPVLGIINHHSTAHNGLITVAEPRSPTAEAYRTLRTNVSYTSVDKPLRTLMVTSTEPGEGKTTVISNLGVVLAQNGYNVVVCDCDLRHPNVHLKYGLINRYGLSTLFAHPADLPNGARQATKIKNLTALTTGQLPPNPAELLGSNKMKTILDNLCQLSDIVLVDTPPTLAVTDAAVLAPSMDGVILVVWPGKTRASALKQTIAQMNQVNAKLIGIVFNNVDLRGKSYAYHNYYYHNYSAYQSYYGSDKGKSEKKKKVQPGQ